MSGWETVVFANALTLLTHLKRAFLDEGLKPMRAEQPELLDRVIAYMEEHMEEKLTLSGMAKHFYVSESTVTQTFRK